MKQSRGESLKSASQSFYKLSSIKYTPSSERSSERLSSILQDDLLCAMYLRCGCDVSVMYL